VGTQRAQDIGAEREAGSKKYRPAGRARWHRPGIAKADASTGDLIDGRRAGRRQATVTEQLHLVDADVVENDKKNVRTRSSCPDSTNQGTQEECESGAHSQYDSTTSQSGQKVYRPSSFPVRSRFAAVEASSELFFHRLDLF